jgi:melibiose permease/lactose/raffinose/galactose permease
MASVLGVAANLLYPRIAARLSRKRIMLISTAAIVAGYGAAALSGVLWPVSFIALALFIMLANMGQVFFTIIMNISLVNTIEYNEWKTGHRDEGVIVSLRTLSGNVSGSLVQLIIMAIYLGTGVLPFSNRISGLELDANRGLIGSADKAAEISDVISAVPHSATFAMRASVCALAAMFFIAVCFIMTRKYIIDEKMFEQMRGGKA